MNRGAVLDSNLDTLRPEVARSPVDILLSDPIHLTSINARCGGGQDADALVLCLANGDDGFDVTLSQAGAVGLGVLLVLSSDGLADIALGVLLIDARATDVRRQTCCTANAALEQCLVDYRPTHGAWPA